jgi:predicted MFS family arabinose efflux permease
MGAGAIIVALAPTFPIMLFGRALMGTGSAVFFITVQLWISRVAHPDNKAYLFSYQQLSSLTGGAIGPVVGGVVAGWLTWRYSMSVSLLAAGLAILASTRLSPPVSAYARQPSADHAPSAEPFRLREVLGPATAMLGNFFYYGGISATVLPLFAADRVGLGPAAIGGVLMLGTVQRFGSALAGARLIGLFGTRRTVLTSQLAMVVCVLSLLLVHSSLGLVVAVSLMAWANIGGSFIVALITDIVPEQHWGTALGFNRAMGDLGAVLAPLMAGFAIDRYGFGAAIAATAAVMLAATMIAAALIPRRVVHAG